MDSTAAFFSVLGYEMGTQKMCRVRKVEGLFSYFIFYPPWHVKYEMLYATFLSLDFYFLWIVKNWVWMKRKIVYEYEWDCPKVRIKNLRLWVKFKSIKTEWMD